MAEEMNFVLYRQGKNVIGPFTSLESATDYIREHKALGYAVLPMTAPGQSVVGSGKTIKRKPVTITVDDDRIASAQRLSNYLTHELGQFGWDHQKTPGTNLNIFLVDVFTRVPKLARYKIQLIKALRQLAENNGANLGLAQARSLIENNGLYKSIMENGE